MFAPHEADMPLSLGPSHAVIRRETFSSSCSSINSCHFFSASKIAISITYLPLLKSNMASLLTQRFNELLAKRDHPKTICPSEVARSMSTTELRDLEVQSWRDLMPELRQMAFQARDRGEVEILQRGEIVRVERRMSDVTGPIRLRLRRSEENA
jgi:hypothetical protein